ncbi:hypothetical protein C8R47DRAFT_1083815 [Mycena vitilis]|nr:hypothetical protein C8R47DRAFT_1083815 [Mycena vitilis]
MSFLSEYSLDFGMQVSNNGPLKTPGLYQIRQRAPGGPYNFNWVIRVNQTDPGSSPGRGSCKISGPTLGPTQTRAGSGLGRVGSGRAWVGLGPKPWPGTSLLPMWWLRILGADAFYLEPYGYPGVRASTSVHSGKDCDDLVLGSEDRTLDYTWAIESAGENLWIIKLAPADGAESEHWELNYYGGP